MVNIIYLKIQVTLKQDVLRRLI